MAVEKSEEKVKGWKLPTGGGDGQFSLLVSRAGIVDTEAGSAKARNLPYNFYYAGRVYNDSLGSTEKTAGYWWTRTAYSRTNVYRMNVSASSVAPAGNSGRYYGFSLRCIATATS